MPFLHTCIRVKDLDASIAFYQEALGLRKFVVMTFLKINLL